METFDPKLLSNYDTMGDFSYLKECIGDLKTKMLSGSYAESLHPIFTMIDSQIFNLERYIENESRKKVIKSIEVIPAT